MKHPEFENTVTHLFKQAESQGSAPAVAFKKDGAWHDISWEQYASDVRTAAAGLVKLGLGKGDTVCILGFNCYEWVVMDLAAMMIGAIQRDNLNHLKYVVGMIRCEELADDMTMDWQTFMGIGSDNDKAKVDELYTATAEYEPATFIYTSGTTGPPKAVMLSNKNLVWTASQAVDMMKLNSSDSSLSYLPLSHIAEQMFTIHAPIIVGWKIYFATGILDVLENLKEVKPTILFGVPRIWEKFYAGLKEKLGEASGLKEKIVNFSLSTKQSFKHVSILIISSAVLFIL